MAVRLWLVARIRVIALAAVAVACQLGCLIREPVGTALFLGDSITEAGHFVDDIAAAWRLENRGVPDRVIPLGVGGETVSGLTEPLFPGVRPTVFSRLDQVLKRHRPAWVVVCYGMNCGLFQPFDEGRYEAYRAGMERLIRTTHAAGARLVILIPPPFARTGRTLPGGVTREARRRWVEDAHAEARAKLAGEPRRYGYYAPYEYYDDVLAVYADWLVTLADHKDVWVVDLRTPLLERRAEAYGDDPVHPNRQGHRIMAETFLKAWPAMAREAGLNN